MNVIEHHRMMLAGEREANRQVMESLRSVPEDRRGNPEYAKARSIIAHNQMARRIWLSRLGAVPKPEGVMFPDWPLERIEGEMAELDRLWGAYLESCRENELGRDVAYTSLDGNEFLSTISEIVTHVHNHSTYHRGQVAMLVTACGGQRAGTDFIALTRRKR